MCRVHLLESRISTPVCVLHTHRKKSRTLMQLKRRCIYTIVSCAMDTAKLHTFRVYCYTYWLSGTTLHNQCVNCLQLSELLFISTSTSIWHAELIRTIQYCLTRPALRKAIVPWSMLTVDILVQSLITFADAGKKHYTLYLMFFFASLMWGHFCIINTGAFLK